MGGVVVLSVLIAVLVGTLGMFGFGTGDAGGGRPVDAKVVAAAPCDPPGAMETVEFTVDGRQRQARFDGCGHQQDEQVTISIPQGAGPDTVVRSAGANTGAADNDRGLGLLLLVLAAIAGGGYGILLNRAAARRVFGRPFKRP
jgi:hypothetical protein